MHWAEIRRRVERRGHRGQRQLRLGYRRADLFSPAGGHHVHRRRSGCGQDAGRQRPARWGRIRRSQIATGPPGSKPSGWAAKAITSMGVPTVLMFRHATSVASAAGTINPISLPGAGLLLGLVLRDMEECRMRAGATRGQDRICTKVHRRHVVRGGQRIRDRLKSNHPARSCRTTAEIADRNRVRSSRSPAGAVAAARPEERGHARTRTSAPASHSAGAR